ncbi:MAG TPA: Crp/Fnr family transcriptional regulator [Candidatus Saccharimonadales bacterium]|nr:Crp/Fnr family transcriptional regulator [Candidatus Saccharimonadales bacterium]
MRANGLTQIMMQLGQLNIHDKGEIYHTQSYTKTLFILQSGYVKRYRLLENERGAIELIYGPGHIFPLSQLYSNLFDLQLNQDNFVYVYQAMTKIKALSLRTTEILPALKKDSSLYIDLFYEAGLRLKSNINRLASTAYKDNYSKIAHQLVSLAEEFGVAKMISGKMHLSIPIPLTSKDISEQVNINLEDTDTVISSLVLRGLIVYKKNKFTIPDIDLLKDVYL